MKIIKYIFLLVFWPKNIDTIRKGLLYSLFWVLGTIAAGEIVGQVGYFFGGRLSSNCYGILQYGGVGIILWATLGVQGWQIETWGGHSLPENINQWVYRTLYVIGSFLLVLSVCWLINK